ncbi:MAG: FtsQ-type POTRA domain-containing protein [bacterium]|nr:MAG: FtsQ-type POTRA domain-containing protein [bacterium]
MRKGRKARPLSKRTARRKSSVRRKVTGQSLRTAAVKGWWVLRGMLAGLIAAAVIYGGWLGGKAVVVHPYLSVKQIIVEGGDRRHDGGVRALSGVTIGQPLLTLDLEEARKRILKDPRIRDAVVVRKLPDTLQIRVEYRSPAAVVFDKVFYLVDTEGVVLAEGVRQTGDYPLITGAGGPWKQGDIASEVLPGLGVLAAFSAYGLIGYDRISEVRLSDDRTALVSLTDTGIVLVMATDTPVDQLDRLARLMETNHYDVNAAGYDLRFQGRVVRLPERSGEKETNLYRRGGSEHGQG